MKERRQLVFECVVKGTLLLAIVLVVALGAYIGLVMVAKMWFRAYAPARFRERVERPVEEFEQITGLSCPASTQPVFSEDTHGGLHGDGELAIAVKTEPHVIDQWVMSCPPWSIQEWTDGPVPWNIAKSCTLGGQRRSSLLESQHVRYIADPRGPSYEPWHNGMLLVVDPRTNSAWLWVWNH